MTTIDISSLLTKAEWNWVGVPENELAACCHWEYARESAILRAMRDFYRRWSDLIGCDIWFIAPERPRNPKLSCPREDAEFKKRHGLSFFELHRRIAQLPLPTAKVFVHLITWLYYSYTWASLTREDKAALMEKLDPNLNFDAPTGTTSGQSFGFTGGVSGSSFQPLREPLARELSSLARANRDPKMKQYPLLLAKDVGGKVTLPIKPFKGFPSKFFEGTSISALVIDLRFNDTAIKEGFAAFLANLRANFPQKPFPQEAFPAAPRRGIPQKHWKDSLERLAFFRVLNACGEEKWPTNVPVDICTRFQKAYDNLDKEEEYFVKCFRTLFPFLPDRSVPLCLESLRTRRKLRRSGD